MPLKNITMKATKTRCIKTIALTLVFTFLFQVLTPTVSYALTSGPSQPESAQFQPVGANDMVDVFTGDFGYNIPLMELPGPNGGYPFNLSYQSGITMDQEASWVGLGWNVNAGSIVRNMRGLPDEFNGESDAIERVLDIKANETYGGSTSIGIELGGADPAIGTGVSTSMKIYNNTYKGVGYGIDMGVSFSKGVGNNMTAGVGFNISLDAQDGVGANVEANIKHKNTTKKGSWEQKRKLSLGIGFHSSGGLNGSISGSVQRTGEEYDIYKDNQPTGKKGSRGSSIQGSSSISFSVPSHTPSIGMEMRSMNFTTHTSFGFGSNAVYVNFGMGGFYSCSKIAKTTERLPAYGYLNLQNKSQAHAMSDFNREKDGVVYRESKNLAAPVLTYDFYIINGQGTGGMFRPYRQDFGHIHEQARNSTGVGGSLGFDMGIPGHYGLNGSFNYSDSRTGDWSGGNEANSLFQFRGKGHRDAVDDGDRYEGAYFKLVGDKAAIPTTELDKILNNQPVELVNDKHELTKTLKSSLGDSHTLVASDMRRTERTPRAVTIVPYTNEQIMTKSPAKIVGTEILPEYDIKVYPTTGTELIRKNTLPALVSYNTLANARGKGNDNKMAKGNHMAGKTVVQPDGKRYVYALPVYNNVQIDETFSVPALDNPTSTVSVVLTGFDVPKYKHSQVTDEYREKTTIPKYAHSYLLTSILGDDYVDADNIPGPSDGDYGYWVKFNYVRTAESYQWRSPYYGANYNPGSSGSSVDDKASYSYGTKEIWYLASAETQTHIAYFEMSKREDGLGAAAQLYGVNNLGSGLKDTKYKLYKLDRIKLYSKELLVAQPDSDPLQTVHFKYNYELCPGTTNSNAEGGGKLTLKKIYFTYKHDRSGVLSPYVFDYDLSNNPSYDLANNKNDRWGTYREDDYCESGSDVTNQEFPYTPQFDPTEQQSESTKEAFKAQIDKNASAWHMTSVSLPSGGKIKIEYESDDYAYVQHKKAAQMFRIESVAEAPDGTPNNQLFDNLDGFWDNANDSRDARKVYFKLETPIPSSVSSTDRKNLIVEKYLDCLYDKKNATYTKPLYAKFKSKLRGMIEDYISGYFNVELDAGNDNKPYCDVAGSTVTIDGTTCYEYAYVVLDYTKVNGNTVYHHPFAVAAWQYMRINLPRVVTGMGDFESGEGLSDMEHLSRIASLGSWINTIQSMFMGFRTYCFDKEFAKTIDLNQSFIRLNAPDGIKYGGGSRVKKLYVEDDPIWGDDKIGQVYDYRLKLEEGREKWTSSGVASYEPIIGGEENVLRTAKKYNQSIPFFTDNNLFFELPVNESYYPAARVGYSKVTISSLATADVEEKIAQSADPNTYEGILTTGRTVHEFYTSKEFPVIAEETDLDPHGKPIVVPLPFIGMVEVSKLTASQGYSIRLNDMHGKPKKVSTYASKVSGGFENTPITQAEYLYKAQPYTYDGEDVYVLDSKVKVLQSDPQMLGQQNDPDGSYDQALTEDMYIGYEYDFFADFRKSVDESGTGGLSFNMDIMGGGPIQFPLPFPWPSFNFNHTSTRIAVTNKIITQAGILDKVIATDGQSTVTTQNLVYDKYTGEPLLTSVNNNYDNKIFNYEYPAYMSYAGTSAAYENILMEFTGRLYKLESGRGWGLSEENLSLVPPYHAIGNNNGMGSSVDAIANSSTIIEYNDLYNYLEEGDEFIAEFLQLDVASGKYIPTGSKKSITLIERRIGATYTGCVDKKMLVFDFNGGSAFSAKINSAVRLMLVRSGKRNLLNMKTGSITSLRDPATVLDEITSSPLFNREKTYSSGTTAVHLYDSLTSQLAQFLNQILDCNGQFPVGTYYMDEAKFLKSDGSLKFPELFGLLKSIDVFDNCGKHIETECLAYGTPTGPQFMVSCGAPCAVYTPPTNPDGYQLGSSSCDIVSESLDPSIIECITDWAEAEVIGGDTPAEVVDTWNDTKRYIPFICNGVYRNVDCSFLSYGTIPNCTTSFSTCHNCYPELATVNGKQIYKGYHLVLRFRDEFVSAVPSGCITAHCLASAKYKVGSNILRTRITNAEYTGPGQITFHYEDDHNDEPSNVSNFCMKPYSFSLPYTYYSIKNVLAASAIELSPYKLDEELYKMRNCVEVGGTMQAQNTAPNNLYKYGYKGIWRPVRTYYYSDERYQGEKSSSSAHMTSMLNLSTDGVFDGKKIDETYDKKFYLFNWSSFLAKKIYPKWLANETVTAFNRNSQSAEARDVLGLYSAVQFDEKGYLPVAVGRNMRQNEMVFENFENTKIIGWQQTDDLNNDGAFDYQQAEIINAALSGNRAMSTKLYENHFLHYRFSRTQFAPTPGKEYMISLWAGGFNLLHSPSEIDQKFSHLMNVFLMFHDKQGNPIPVNNSGLTKLRMKPKGKIYEGKGTFWRKIEEKFKVPQGTYSVTIGFGSTGSSVPGQVPYGTMYSLVGSQFFIDQRACFDDLRIFPADGLMTTYVYDRFDYRLLAQSDENNFPTVYGYTPSGSLMVVKKLTEEGLKTLKEIRSNTKRLPLEILTGEEDQEELEDE